MDVVKVSLTDMRGTTRGYLQDGKKELPHLGQLPGPHG